MIRLSQWFIMLCLWLYCISITKMSDMTITDLSCYISDCTVSVSLRRVIRLSQWFIMLCLWLYCISITKMSDSLSQWFIMLCLWLYCISITKIEWYDYHSDLSCYVSDCTVSVSLRWVIWLSQWFIMLCFWLYCTKKNNYEKSQFA